MTKRSQPATKRYLAKPVAALRAWLTARGMSQESLVFLMKSRDPTVAMSSAKLTRILGKREAPTEHQRLVLQLVTGIHEAEWLPPLLRKLKRDTAA